MDDQGTTNQNDVARITVIAEEDGTIVGLYVPIHGEGENLPEARIAPLDGQVVRDVDVPVELLQHVPSAENVFERYRLRIEGDSATLVDASGQGR